MKKLLRVEVFQGPRAVTTLWVRLRDDVDSGAILQAEVALNELTDHRFHFTIEEDPNEKSSGGTTQS